MRPSHTAAWMAGFLTSAVLFASTDFQINTYTTSNQNNPSVAAASSGDFVVVWEGQDGAGTGVRGRRFASDGSALAAPFAVNSYTTSSQFKPAVAVRGSGEFVVVWSGYGANEQFLGVFGQRYDSAGVAQGGEFHVNTYTNSNQLSPRVVFDPTGAFTVVWASTGADDPGAFNTAIVARRFNSSGSAVTAEFQVNSYTSGDQRYPNLAFQSNGDFVVVWQSYGSSGTDDSGASVQLQRFSSAGSMLDGEMQVNTYTSSAQLEPIVAVEADNDFIVVWESIGSLGSDSDNFSVQARRFSSQGAAVGSQFQVNSYTTGPQNSEGDGVAITADGDLVVVWDDQNGGAADPTGVRGIILGSDGSPVTAEFQVNCYTTGTQGEPSVAATSGNNFVVVWAGYAENEEFFGVRGRTLQVPDPIFADGFESGNVSVWSDSVP